MLICFLLINYLVKEKAEKAEGGETGDESDLEAGKKQTLAKGGTFDESAFMSPAGTPFIPASRTPAAVAAARIGSHNVFNDLSNSKLLEIKSGIKLEGSYHLRR